MKALFLRCAVCGSLESERLFPSFYLGEPSSMQWIVICRDCGLVYRNPHIPALCANVYEKVDNWTPEESVYVQRLGRVADEIARRITVGNDELFLDVGCGPGWLASALSSRFPGSRAVLLEPSVEVAQHAKMRNVHAAVLPSVLGEADLPEAAFSLIAACGVDYLFADHRGDMQRVWRLLREGGVLYIERNVFVDTEALTGRALLDIEEMFGLNPMMNTWFGREQFTEYLGQFFEVFDGIEYTADLSPAPHFRPNTVIGVFCRKRSARQMQQAEIPNRYAEHIEALRGHSCKSSLEDLRALADAGVRRVAICGCGPEARELARMVRQNELFSIAGFIGDGEDTIDREALTGEFASVDPSRPIDVILVASIERQDAYVARLQETGNRNVLPCFRRGLKTFWSEGATAIQMKAFLPALLRAHQERLTVELLGAP